MSMPTNDMEREKADRIAEAAAFWDARLRAPDCTAQDRENYAKWLDADPEHAAAIKQARLIVSSLKNQSSHADMRAMRDAALAAGQRRRARLRWTAAAGVGVLALAVLLWTGDLQSIGWRPGETYSTGAGQRSSVRLRDGSTLELNSKTRIEVAFTPERRSVRLVEGQAMFHVARDTRRPFIVEAADREIVALGTVFDVRVDQSAVSVTLLEGKVAVRPEGSPAPLGIPIPMEPEDVGERAPPADSRNTPEEIPGTVVLYPGQQLIVARNAAQGPGTVAAPELTVRDIDVQKVTGWLE
ncbi:MAG TPA: FecR domain-containing protein, partial [Steroidobacteraceae bacterium]